MATVRGQVKWFDDKKGFGFISQESGKDVFVHFRAIVSPSVQTLKDGQDVEFEIQQAEKGLQAVNVSVV
jgi:CspA family cold shock protein